MLEFLDQLVTPEEKPVRAKLVRNVLFSGLRAALLWPVPFLLIPFILRKLGVAGYGTWAVFLAIVSLSSLADLGLGGTLTKQVAEHHATKNWAALGRLISTALTLYSFVASFLVILLWVVSNQMLLLFFRDSGSTHQELQGLWHWLLMIVAINVLILPFYSVVGGLQRMDLSNIAAAFNNLCSASLTVLFLVLGWGLTGLMMATFYSAFLTLLLFVWMARKLLPEVGLNPVRFRWAEAREIFSFSLRLYVTQMAVAIQNQIEKLYLARLVGVGPAGWYNIASEASLRIRRIPELLLSPVMAAASELDAKKDEPRLIELYCRSHKYLALIAVPLMVYVAAVSSRLVDLWLGPKLSMVALPVTVLVGVNTLNLLTGPGALILIGKGWLKPGVDSTLVAIVLIVVLSFLLIYFYGFSGAVVGILLAVVVATVLFFYWFYRCTRYPFVRVVREAYLKPTLCALAALAVALSIRAPDHLGWVGMMGHCAAFGTMYLFGLVLTRFFDVFDVAQVETFLPIARLARRIISAG